MRKNYLINGGNLCKFDAIIKLLTPVHYLPFDFREVQPCDSSLLEPELRSEIFQSHPSWGVYLCKY